MKTLNFFSCSLVILGVLLFLKKNEAAIVWCQIIFFTLTIYVIQRIIKNEKIKG